MLIDVSAISRIPSLEVDPPKDTGGVRLLTAVPVARPRARGSAKGSVLALVQVRYYVINRSQSLFCGSFFHGFFLLANIRDFPAPTRTRTRNPALTYHRTVKVAPEPNLRAVAPARARFRALVRQFVMAPVMVTLCWIRRER